MPGKAEIRKYTALEEVFESFDGLKVLIIGDVMIDSYLWGKVERISPEAPVPVVHVTKRDKRLGGAANVALNVQAIGATPVLCSVIGDDSEGEEFVKLLSKAGLTDRAIFKSSERITTIKHRVISGAHHMLRVDEEVDTELQYKDQQILLGKIKDQIPDCDVVIFEDYDKGVINSNIIAETIAFAKIHKVPTVVDPKKRNFLNYKGATLFKPNKKELKEGLKIDSNLNNLAELEAAVDQLQQKLEAATVLITLSENGVFIKDGSTKSHIPAHVREISDVSGAGDTVISVAAACCALYLPAQFTAALSNLAGGLVCEHVGVVPVSKKVLLAEAKKLHLHERLS